VALQARVGRVGLELESGELGSLLLFAIESIKATLECIGEEKVHR